MSDSADPLRHLVSRLEQAGLRAPAALFLDAVSPLDVVGSQMARFSRPFLGGTRVEPLVTALEEPAAWAELRRLLAGQD